MSNLEDEKTFKILVERSHELMRDASFVFDQIADHRVNSNLRYDRSLIGIVKMTTANFPRLQRILARIHKKFIG